MDIHRFEYLTILLLCFSVPFMFTLVHRRILVREKFLIFNPSILLAAIPYLIWDIWAVNNSRWSFNPKVMTGVEVWNLPIEEVFFFTLIPQSCLLLWAGMKKYQNWSEMRKDLLKHKWAKKLWREENG